MPYCFTSLLFFMTAHLFSVEQTNLKALEPKGLMSHGLGPKNFHSVA